MVYIYFWVLIANLWLLIDSQAPIWLEDPQVRVSRFNVFLDQYCGKQCKSSSFTVPFSYGQTSTKITLSITGIQLLQSSASLGIKMSAYNITNSKYIFYVSIINETVIYNMRVDVLTMNSTVKQYYTGYGALICQYLNKGQGYRSQNYSMSILNSRSHFNSDNNGVKCAVYPMGYLVFNPEGSYLYLNWNTYINKTHYTVVFQTKGKNIVTFINFNILSFDSNYMKVNRYFRAISLETVICPGSSCETNTVWTYGATYQNQHKQFWGMSGFNFTKNRQIKWYFNTSSFQDLAVGYIQTSGVVQIKISGMIVAFRQCPDFDNDNTTQQYLDPSSMTCKHLCNTAQYVYKYKKNLICGKCHYSCLTCNNINKNNCSTCSSVNNRQQNTSGSLSECLCESGFVNVGLPQCRKCEFYMPGCQTCQAFSKCSTCKPGLQTNLDQSMCSCTDLNRTLTRLGQCIDLRACLTYFKEPNGTVYCIQCDIKKNYVLSQYMCKCKSGYTQDYDINGIAITCIQQCGNEILTEGEQCDDGNLINQDGCNNLCKVQESYICFQGIINISFCLKNYANITYYHTLKNEHQSNTLDVYFSFTPLNLKFGKNLELFKKFLHSSLQNNPSLTKFTYYCYLHEEREIRFTLRSQYLQKVDQSQSYLMKFQMSDQTKSQTLSTSTYFKLESKNYPLQMQNSQVMAYGVISYILLVCVVLSFLVAFASIFSQNWIGIQLLLTIQYLFFYLFFLNQIDGQLSSFIGILKFSTGYNKNFSNYSIYDYYSFSDKLFRFGYAKQFILNFNISAVLLILPLILLLIRILFPFIKSRFFDNKKKKFSKIQKQEQTMLIKQKASRIHQILSTQFIIGKLSLSVTLIFLFQSMLSFYIQHKNQKTHDQTLNKFYLNIFMYGVLAFQCGIIAWLYIQSCQKFPFNNSEVDQTYIKIFKFKRVKPAYPLIYVMFQTLKFMFLILFYSEKHCIFVVMGIDSFYLIFYLIYRPYAQQRNTQQPYCYGFHNIHNVWNGLGLIGFSVIIHYCNQENVQSIKRFNPIIIFSVLVLSWCSLILAFLRLFLSKRILKCLKKNQQQQYLIEEIQQNTKRNLNQSPKPFKNQKQQQLKQQSLKKQIKSIRKKIMSGVQINIPPFQSKELKKFRNQNNLKLQKMLEDAKIAPASLIKINKNRQQRQKQRLTQQNTTRQAKVRNK